MADDISTSNLLHFPAPTPLPKPALLADISTLEVAILATLWNYHPRPLRISEIYLGVRTAAGGKLEPCASAIGHLAARGLVSDSGAPFFRYQLNHDGIFIALYLAIAGANNRFKIARVPGDLETTPADTTTAKAGQGIIANRLTINAGHMTIANAATFKDAAIGFPNNAVANASTSTPVLRILPDPLARQPIVKPASEVEFEFCHTGCGRIASSHCECGNAVCSAHRYNADGQHDPAGACSACYDEVQAERIGIQQCGDV